MNDVAREGSNVFLSYSSTNKEVAERVATALKAAGLPIWFDEWNIAKGLDFQEQLEKAIHTARAAVFLLGSGGGGRWAQAELRACLVESRDRGFPIIPVMLPGAPPLRDVSLFLATLSAVDMRSGVTDASLEGLARAVLGSNVLSAALTLVGAMTRKAPGAAIPEVVERVDLQGVIAMKYRLNVLSELVAEEAARQAAHVRETLPNDTLATWVPVVVALRWKRGYASALRTLLWFEGNETTLASFPIEELEHPCQLEGGIVGAREDDDARILVLLDDQPAARVTVANLEMRQIVVDSLVGHGRLGVAQRVNATLIERLSSIPIRCSAKPETEKTFAIRRNVEILAPILARVGLPGYEWLSDRSANAELPGLSRSGTLSGGPPKNTAR